MFTLSRVALSLLLLAFLGCDRVPEQALRDEQSRSRKFREAFESEHDENVALRARLEKLDKGEKQSCETLAR